MVLGRGHEGQSGNQEDRLLSFFYAMLRSLSPHKSSPCISFENDFNENILIYSTVLPKHRFYARHLARPGISKYHIYQTFVAACYCGNHKPRIIFTFLRGLKKRKEKKRIPFHDTWKLCEMQMVEFQIQIPRICSGHSHIHSFAYCQ